MPDPQRAPFPYPGGKRRAAHLVWAALGKPRHYIEPFFGSGAVLLNRPSEPGLETVSDLDGHLCNFWRAIKFQPRETAKHADYPVLELCLHAWHAELVRRTGEVRARLEADPRWCDPELAGRWAWGASQWIGGGWCSERARTSDGVQTARRLPNLWTAGTGVQAPSVVRGADEALEDLTEHAELLEGPVDGPRPWRKRPSSRGGAGRGLSAFSLGSVEAWFAALSDRMRGVRVITDDFERVLTPASIYPTHGQAGVFLDPPYSLSARAHNLYAQDAAGVALRARTWALAHGDDRRLRIVLAGLAGEHDELESHGWAVVQWRGHGGGHRRADNPNRERERLWLSPHCIRPVAPPQLSFGFDGPSSP